MPDPPPVGLWTRFVLENPYPLGGGLLVIGVVLAWVGLREGQGQRIRIAALPLLLGAAVLLLGWQVRTSGERARAVTRELVDAVVDGDLVAADSVFAADALFHFGSPRNVAHDLAFIREQLSRFARRYSIEDNTITMLRGYTETADRASVHLACWNDAGGYGPTP